MSEILELESEKQISSVYGDRYRLIVITELYYYELVYRFGENTQPHLTVSRMTYGKVWKSRSGFTRVIRNEEAIKEHARKTVHSIERRLASAMENW